MSIGGRWASSPVSPDCGPEQMPLLHRPVPQSLHHLLLHPAPAVIQIWGQCRPNHILFDSAECEHLSLGGVYPVVDQIKVLDTETGEGEEMPLASAHTFVPTPRHLHSGPLSLG